MPGFADLEAQVQSFQNLPGGRRCWARLGAWRRRGSHGALVSERHIWALRPRRCRAQGYRSPLSTRRQAWVQSERLRCLVEAALWLRPAVCQPLPLQVVQRAVQRAFAEEEQASEASAGLCAQALGAPPVRGLGLLWAAPAWAVQVVECRQASEAVVSLQVEDSAVGRAASADHHTPEVVVVAVGLLVGIRTAAAASAADRLLRAEVEEATAAEEVPVDHRGALEVQDPAAQADLVAAADSAADEAALGLRHLPRPRLQEAVGLDALRATPSCSRTSSTLFSLGSSRCSTTTGRFCPTWRRAGLRVRR